MKNITISAEEIHQSSSKPSHTKQIRQDAGTGGGILIPGPPVGLRGREAEVWHQSPPMVGGNNQWTLIRRCNLSWCSCGDSKHLGACRQSTVYVPRISKDLLWGRLSAPEPAVKLHTHTRQKSK